MQPIAELLNRIHLEPEFGRGYFEIVYHGRMNTEIIRVSFREVSQLPGRKFAFHVFDEDGIRHCVPMNRVQKVYKDGELIWTRDSDKQK